ncbi:ABC transporter ATP-binding protein [Noviherbaspirillum cavernae]|uniref:ABC transporter ATP-binding protein n=1 Tax=Noviherbaspirillum cavernae TaxID=2320862 RepID=A0A418X3K4_9BURK|nr:ABC transporter ATP-binding protein [Noviherbaspirillum cavernae]RJG06971.1 ABC transporter ATP-binding protein [Noviherbaspirillum cavernae]
MTSANKTPLLSANGVTVRFGGLTAIDNVSFDVYPGELLGLIGPNGAGKTTMLRAITGVVRATEGNVTLEGESLNGLPIHKRIQKGLSLSQQLVKPFREISVLDNVALAAGVARTHSPLKSLMHVSQKEEEAIGRQMLERVGIAAHADQKPGIQPLGILKRLEMARALALKPKLFLLDEPLAGLNSKEANALATTIAEINRQGVTIILIEHNLGEVMRICQRLVVLDNGRKIASGEPRAVMNDPAVRAAYLGGDTIAEAGVKETAHAGDAHA